METEHLHNIKIIIILRKTFIAMGPRFSNICVKTLAVAGMAAATLTSNIGAEACTGITLKSADGSVVMARTIEWALNDNHNRYVVVPRGHEWVSMTPDGSSGRSFAGKYGYVGLAVEQAEFIVEGLNEMGLSAGLFYFPGYGKYEDFDAAQRDSNMADLQLVSYILGHCATVDDVIAEVKNLHIHNIDPRASTAHWRFGEPGGRQVVLEIIDKECLFYENTVGVLTNSPSFPWHLTNLNNYVNLHSGAVAENSVGSLDLHSFGGGSGMLGLPGDFTPPSRFIRAAFFQATAPVQDNAEESVFQAFHILNNFDLPIGMQTNPGEQPADIPSATQWTSATDLSGRKIYFRSMFDCTIRCIDLNRINFAKAKFVDEPMDKTHRQSVKYL